MAVIGGFRSDLLITRKTDGNFGNVSSCVLFSKVAYQRKRWKRFSYVNMTSLLRTLAIPLAGTLISLHFSKVMSGV